MAQWATFRNCHAQVRIRPMATFSFFRSLIIHKATIVARRVQRDKASDEAGEYKYVYNRDSSKTYMKDNTTLCHQCHQILHLVYYVYQYSLGDIYHVSQPLQHTIGSCSGCLHMK